ncbi:MAG: Holliday junction branch migration protein RuvA [Muribaculaceae bacterium]|nr:Holliday junction branch migration protein RuvA [Muribaculaceae bacterium]
MIEYIRGKVTELTPATAVIETQGGVAYLLNITLTTFSALEGVVETRLLVHEAIREDAWVLFGFNDERERAMFRLLIGVSGVGANTARMILSSIATPELEQVIASGDPARLKAVKGVGAKTAQRIIVDLKDKIKVDELTLSIQPSVNNEVFDEALAALVMLGFQRQQSQKVLKKLFDANSSITVEAAIKRALTMM